MIQLDHLQHDETDFTSHLHTAVPMNVVATILKDHLVDLQKNDIESVAKHLNVTLDEVYEAVGWIESFEAEPGRLIFG